MQKSVTECNNGVIEKYWQLLLWAKQNGGQNLNQDGSSLPKFQYNYLKTKQEAMLNDNY